MVWVKSNDNSISISLAHGANMNFNNFDMNLLRVFDALMQEKSVTRAAERLHRTQSAISYSLAKLRALFADELFVRDGGAMRPTSVALDVYPELSGALMNIRVLLDRRQRFEPASSRRNFRIGLTDYHSTILVPDLIREFTQNAPHASFNVIPINSPDLMEMLTTGRLDCALSSAYVGSEHALAELPLGNYELLCAAWAGSTMARERIDLNRYLELPHLQISADGMSEGIADQALRKIGLKRRVLVTIANYLLLPWALRETELISHCGSSLTQVFDASTGIIFFPPPLEVPEVRLSLLFSRQLATDEPTMWLLNLISEIYERTEIRRKEAVLNSPNVLWHE